MTPARGTGPARLIEDYGRGHGGEYAKDLYAHTAMGYVFTVGVLMSIKKSTGGPGNVAAYQKKRLLRGELIGVLRTLLNKHRFSPLLQQKLQDLTVTLEPDDVLDFSRLPVEPRGFFTRLYDMAQNKGSKVKTLCLLRMISMAVMYYWLYSELEDDQDAESCLHYVRWLRNYTDDFQVYGDGVKGFYLASPKSVKRDPDTKKAIGPPAPPKWLKEGLTV